MPTYTYECRKCGHTFDIFHSISATPRVKCEECGGGAKRLMGTGAGIIFKGSGFYETDYKKGKGGDGKSSSSSSSDGKSSDSKSSKSESKKSESSSKSKD